MLQISGFCICKFEKFSGLCPKTPFAGGATPPETHLGECYTADRSPPFYPPIPNINRRHCHCCSVSSACDFFHSLDLSSTKYSSCTDRCIAGKKREINSESGTEYVTSLIIISLIFWIDGETVWELLEYLDFLSIFISILSRIQKNQ